MNELKTPVLNANKNLPEAIYASDFLLRPFKSINCRYKSNLKPNQTGLDEIQAKTYKVKTLRAGKHIFKPGNHIGTEL